MPKNDPPIKTCRGKQGPIRRVGDCSDVCGMTLEFFRGRRAGCGLRHIPEPKDAICARGRQGLTIGGEGEVVDVACVSC